MRYELRLGKTVGDLNTPIKFLSSWFLRVVRWFDTDFPRRRKNLVHPRRKASDHNNRISSTLNLLRRADFLYGAEKTDEGP